MCVLECFSPPNAASMPASTFLKTASILVPLFDDVTTGPCENGECPRAQVVAGEIKASASVVICTGAMRVNQDFPAAFVTALCSPVD
jgi:hypothetical protein